MANAKNLGFGYTRDEIRAPALWGARAIFTGGIVDIVWDRQDLKADDAASKKALIAALNSPEPGSRRNPGAIARFKMRVEGMVAEGKIDTDDDGTTVIRETIDGVVFLASTNGSHGYLYMTAWLAAAEPKAEKPRTHGYAAPEYPKDGLCTICGKRRDDSIHA